jgi:hypothetical protein
MGTLPEQVPQSPTSQHKRLDIFLGRWSIEGQNSENAPDAAGARIIGEELYDWLPGNFFLSYHWVHHMDGLSHKGVGIIGYNVENGEYFAHNYDNMGYTRHYQLKVDADTWTISGEFERARIVFGIDGRSMKVNWEIVKHGRTWVPLCEWKAEKTPVQSP